MSTALEMDKTNAAGSAPRVMVVDDAVVVRGLMARWLAEAGMEVVGTYRNGKVAVDDVERVSPDVIILDIEMPEMDGLTALPLILKKKPNVLVIVASTLTRRNAELSMKCLGLGAKDYIPKPESNRDVTTSPEFRQELIDKVKVLALKLGKTGSHVASPQSLEPHKLYQGTYKTKSYSPNRPKVLAIGSSTGGPQALALVLQGLRPLFKQIPVFVTQHMPATFTPILAEHLGKAAGVVAAEGKDGEAVVAGRIYVAPGGKHMTIVKGEGGAFISLQDGPAINFCKPAVDPMFESLSQVYGGALFGLVLTGMGHDGANGVKAIANSGGNVIAQDEATSTVWGMPGAAAHTGQCAEVLPLSEIAPRVLRIFSGER